MAYCGIVTALCVALMLLGAAADTVGLNLW